MQTIGKDVVMAPIDPVSKILDDVCGSGGGGGVLLGHVSSTFKLEVEGKGKPKAVEVRKAFVLVSE